jgi:uncharacterized cupin superfamily protein
MKRINLGSANYAFDDDDPGGFRSGHVRTGPELGAVNTGASGYLLPPGQAICPYHYEYGEEEWLLVLSGTPTLRHPDGTATLQPLDLVHFPEGPEGAHMVRNETDEEVRVLMFSNRARVGMAVYPDSDKVFMYTGNEDDTIRAPRPQNVDYWHGEPGT